MQNRYTCAECVWICFLLPKTRPLVSTHSLPLLISSEKYKTITHVREFTSLTIYKYIDYLSPKKKWMYKTYYTNFGFRTNTLCYRVPSRNQVASPISRRSITLRQKYRGQQVHMNVVQRFFMRYCPLLSLACCRCLAYWSDAFSHGFVTTRCSVYRASSTTDIKLLLKPAI